MKINMNGKKFHSLSNTKNGEVSNETIFQYRQENDLIFANYEGGGIIKGHLLRKVVNNEYIEFVYHHINSNNEIITGKCKSIPK